MHRQENKGPLKHARMRQRQVITLHLHIAEHQQIQIDDARPACNFTANAAHLGFNGLQR